MENPRSSSPLSANPKSGRNNRRDFLKTAAAGAGFMVLPSYVVGQSKTKMAPSNRINVALVGVGGKGRGPTIDSLEEYVVALCDVDKNRVQEGIDGREDFAAAVDTHVKKGAKWYQDYREMFHELGDKIDAVIISTPDHMHYPITHTALNLGKHVYTEKPLTHTVEEARILAKAAKKAGVVTQMGNQGHSLEGTRLVKEWIEAGVIGDVREVHSWTNRPIRDWAAIHGTGKPDHGEGAPKVPDGLDWELWQGVADRRAYDPNYLPFSWRGYVDYGCGALGDMACHIMDSAFWGLGLGSPTHVEGKATSTMTGYTFPKHSVVSFRFPARGTMPGLTYNWYDGGMFPTLPAFLKGYTPLQNGKNQNGTLIVGDGLAILTDTYSGSVRILPDDKFREIRTSGGLPPKTLRRIKGSHLGEFYNAIREDREASSDFSYAGPFTETVLLGCVAQRVGRRLKFNGKKGQFVGDAEANKMLRKDYPDGWILG